MKNSYKYAGIDFSGKRFGKLVVVRKAPKGRSWWECKCDCGNEITLPAYRLFEYKSCGCLEKENKANLTKYTRTHGMTNTRLYSVWCKIKERCTNPNTEHYDRYGGRGICICDDWKNTFVKFYEWAINNGYDENSTGKEQSIDRIDVNGNYEPTNCRWVTKAEQARNRSNTLYIRFHEELVPLSTFAYNNKIDYSYAKRHHESGLSAEKILEEWNFLHNIPDEYMTITEAANYYCKSKESLYIWIKKGKLKALKRGQKLYIPKGQNIERPEDRDSLGRFISRTNKA